MNSNLVSRWCLGRRRASMLRVCGVLFMLAVPGAATVSDPEEGVLDLARQISEGMKDNNKTSIAVVEFSGLDGSVSGFGQFLAEELITQIFTVSPGKFEVVERAQLSRVLAEQQLSVSGLVDQRTIAAIGQTLGIDALVLGSITDLGDKIKINARLISVETAKVFAVGSVKIPKTEMVNDLLQRPGQLLTVASATRGSDSARPSRRGGSTFEDSFLQVKVRAFSVDKKGNARLTLVFKNLSEDSQLVAFENLSTAVLSDDHGNSSDLVGLRGMVVAPSPFLGQLNRSSYTLLNPGVPHTVILFFKRPRDQGNGTAPRTSGRLFSFSSRMFRDSGGRAVGFSISIPEFS